MRVRAKDLRVAMPSGIVAVMLNGRAPLGSRLWPPAEMAGMPDPTGPQVALLMFVFAVEVLAFVAGVLFLSKGPSRFKALAPAGERWAMAAYASLGWLLVSWVPHDALHQHNGMDLGGLVGIELAFHVTLVLAGLCVMGFVMRAVRAPTAAVAAAPTAPALPSAAE